MRFQKQALQKAVEQALTEDRRRWDQVQVEAALDLAKARDEWVETWAPAWADAAKVIQRRLRKGEPVMRSDLPTDTHRGVAMYEEYGSRRPKKPADYRPPAELLMLLSVLPTISDDEVSTSGLRELGITAAALRMCVCFLAKNTATN